MPKTKPYEWTEIQPAPEGETEDEEQARIKNWYKTNNVKMPWNARCCFCESELSAFPDDYGHSINPFPDNSVAISHRARKHPDYGYRACGSCNDSSVIMIRMAIAQGMVSINPDGYIVNMEGIPF